jgi:RNA polymerase sigma-70 factor, ECF subfamily
MTAAELIFAIQKNDQSAKKQLFDMYAGRLSAIAARYTKSQAQADEALNTGFHNILNRLQQNRTVHNINLDELIEKEFIRECISFIRSIRSEYYVSSTVYAPGETATSKNYNLFENTEVINYSSIDKDILIKALQQLVPSQRLIFNLHVVDGYSLQEAALMLESSEGTVKSNLEKARYNLQKNIEKSLKTIKA